MNRCCSSPRIFALFINLVVLGMVGCGKKTELDLLHSDLEAFSQFNESGPRDVDHSSNHRYSQIFGGYSGQHVRNFIEERIHHFVRYKDILETSPRQPIYQGWTRNPGPQKGEIGAANLGTGYWFQGLLDNTVYSMRLFNGQKIEATSSRVGVMVFGPGYKEAIKKSGGATIQLPAAYRQAILVHEARHSDCNGGITEADIQRARQAQSYLEFFSGLEAKKCGHLHSPCKSGNLKGDLACDAETWGSYGVMVVFLEAALKNSPLGSTEWQILNGMMIDMKSRLEFDYDTMIHSTTDHPDLTSLGLR